MFLQGETTRLMSLCGSGRSRISNTVASCTCTVTTTGNTKKSKTGPAALISTGDKGPGLNWTGLDWTPQDCFMLALRLWSVSSKRYPLTCLPPAVRVISLGWSLLDIVQSWLCLDCCDNNRSLWAFAVMYAPDRASSCPAAWPCFCLSIWLCFNQTTDRLTDRCEVFWLDYLSCRHYYQHKWMSKVFFMWSWWWSTRLASACWCWYEFTLRAVLTVILAPWWGSPSNVYISEETASMLALDTAYGQG